MNKQRNQMLQQIEGELARLRHAERAHPTQDPAQFAHWLKHTILFSKIVRQKIEGGNV